MDLGRVAREQAKKVLPSAAQSYLRQELPAWKKHLRRNQSYVANALSARAFTSALRSPIRPKTVVWESFAGNGALCNPEALFRAMIDGPRYAEFTHTWVLSRKASDSAFLTEFAGHPRVHFVDHKTPEYYRVLETSQYLVNNATFPTDFIKRPEQTYLNTWHGTPLKKMGYDIADGAVDSRNILRNFMSADYLLAQNSFMTEQMYLSAYRLRNVFEGAIIEEGYPRTDHMFGPGAWVHARQVLRDRGIDAGSRKVLTFAPTWRGESFSRPDVDVQALRETIGALRRHPQLRDWVILLKAHQVVYEQLKDDPDLASVLVPNDVPANEVLALSDLLVSDYSSIFVDYLASGRPLALHIPDVHSYSDSRGLYLDIEQMPGPVSTTSTELLDNVTRILAGGGLDEPFPAAAHRYRQLAARFTPHDDGDVSRRIIDVVFNGNEDGYRVRRGFRDGRTRLAIYLGGMITNGITSSALNLLSRLDPNTYDVTALYCRSDSPDYRANAALIPDHVRHVVRDPGLLQYALQASMDELVKAPDDWRNAHLADAGLWQWEWRRLFGDADFDAAIDFSGYSNYWTRLMLHGSAPRKAIWLHDDLRADAEREIDGERPHRDNLYGVFKLYRGFDALVSVSPGLSRINAESLQEFAPAAKFVSARNTIDVERVLSGTDQIRFSASDAPTMSLNRLTDVIAELGRLYSYDTVVAEASRQQLVSTFISRGNWTTFVTVGWLSPEKNHARLIRAFARVHEQNENTRLLIIGDGPLRGELTALTQSLGIAEWVVFTGWLRDPFALMAECDCFVMSSNYEGQPDVILEARVLGLPVVTTHFGSVHSAMAGGGGLIVGQDVEALAEGMRSFIRGEVRAEPFDGGAYNAEVIGEFHAAVFGTGTAARPTAREGVPNRR
ncbi:hypothetical protein GCM10022261_04820 [Brevibacterium daeguense]|uniref:Glycosyltransferase n=1 Tax=Brevibacterium daeguense TaxID=909936 RepID=A0ABP8EG87_9MICO|nr:glycosyltransferase [Brevibacterium daeguense]